MSLYTMTRSSIRGMLHTLCRPEITGLHNVPKEGGFIVASNHLSFWTRLSSRHSPHEMSLFLRRRSISPRRVLKAKP